MPLAASGGTSLANPTGWFGDVVTAEESAAGLTATVYAVCITLNL